MRARADFLRDHPLCAYHELDGGLAPSDTVDHLYPHKGDQELFWRREWWVACCATCHNGFKQAVEREGQAALDQLAHRLGRPARGGGGV